METAKFNELINTKPVFQYAIWANKLINMNSGKSLNNLLLN